MRRMLAGVGFLGLALACGGDPGADEQRILADEPALPQLRVDLEGSDVAPRIVGAALVQVPAAQKPMPSLTGSLMLVGRAGGEMAVASPFSLPAVLHIERLSESPAHETLPLATASLSLYLDAFTPLERVEVIDTAGNVLSALDAEGFESGGESPSLRPLATTSSTAPDVASLLSEHRNIRFLGREDSPGFALTNPVIGVVDEMLDFNPSMARVVRTGLSITPKRSLSAIKTIGMARLRDANIVGAAYGSTVLFNTGYEFEEPVIPRTVVHESIHAFIYLVDGDGSVPLNLTPWPEEVIAAARATIEKFYLQAGLTSVWDQLHGDAVSENLASPYGSITATGFDMTPFNAQAAQQGFASARGSAEAIEDMSEYVARVIVDDTVDVEGRSPVCDEVRSAGSPFPLTRVLPYAKIKLLEGLELLTAEQVRACVGQPAIEGPPGIHFDHSDPDLKIALTSNLNGGFITLDGTRFLGVLAGPSSKQMLIRVLADEAQPRGMYRLDNIGLFGINAATNAILYYDEAILGGARTSERGLVFVTEFSDDRIAGAVFFTNFRDAFGIVTRSYPLGTFRIDR